MARHRDILLGMLDLFARLFRVEISLNTVRRFVFKRRHGTTRHDYNPA